jgi:hypothetical protein
VDWGDFWLTTGAVVVGGAISTAGNIWAVRHQLRLEQRVRLLETIHRARQLLGPNFPYEEIASLFLTDEQAAAMQSISGQGQVITKREYELTAAVKEWADKIIELEVMHSLSPPPKEWHRELDSALRALEDYLTVKLKPSGAPSR